MCIRDRVKDGFYDGLKFHRVIPDFMAQGGDPLGNGTGGSGQNIDAEFSSEKHIRGTVSMARAQDPNSADSQFFICFTDASWLDGQYTIWGQVIEGMEHVDKIKKEDGSNDEEDDFNEKPKKKKDTEKNPGEEHLKKNWGGPLRPYKALKGLRRPYKAL